MFRYNLTAIYWIKNEGRYLPEYIEFHLLQGFDHFIFYDNESTDKTGEILETYIEEGLVELRCYPDGVKQGGASKNYWVMNECLAEHHRRPNKSKWIHYHAVDEFTFCKNNKTIPEFLKDYEDFGGLAVNWKLFGFGGRVQDGQGHIKRPEGLTFENFTEALKFDANCHVKTIIQPQKTDAPVPNTHWFHTNKTVDEKGVQVLGPFNTMLYGTPANLPPRFDLPPTNYTFDNIQNNHYVTKSLEEFYEKNNKGLLDHGNKSENQARNSHTTDELDQWMGDPPCGTERLSDILVYVEPVREAIKKRFSYNPDLLELINH